jgi:uncharacterized membrane protein YhaH (DUF805 family)
MTVVPAAASNGAMTFSEAVRDAFAKYVTFSGRSSRPAYWWWYLFTLIAVAIAAVIDLILGTYVLTVIVSVVILLPNLAVLVRRLHDAGHSGWWILIGLLPLIGFIVLLIFTLQPSKPPNHWGEAPDAVAAPAI